MADDPKLWVSLTTSLLAVAGGVYATIAGRQSIRLNADLQAQQAEKNAQRETLTTIAKFRDPLMHASYDLQSRLFNILVKDFLGRYYTNGNIREKTYAIENTVFLVAQFLGWTEAIRQGLQFLDLGENEQTRALRALQDRIYTHLQRDDLGPSFRLFAGEQRAVGELMIVRDGGAWRCIGFAEFMTARNPVIDQWLDPLRDGMLAGATSLESSRERLQVLQHSLVDLLEFLDPHFIRFPSSHRSKVGPSYDHVRSPMS